VKYSGALFTVGCWFPHRRTPLVLMCFALSESYSVTPKFDFLIPQGKLWLRVCFAAAMAAAKRGCGGGWMDATLRGAGVGGGREALPIYWCQVSIIITLQPNAYIT